MKNGRYEIYVHPYNVTQKLVFRGTMKEAVLFLRGYLNNKNITARMSVQDFANITEGVIDCFVDSCRISVSDNEKPFFIKKAAVIEKSEG